MDNKRTLNQSTPNHVDHGCVAATTQTKNLNDVSERLRNGDPKAFNTVYMQWYEPVCRVLTGMMRNAQDAEDLTQDVFSTLWLQRAKIIPEKDIRGLIFTLARHLALKHIRRNKVQNTYLASTGKSEEGIDSTAEMIAAKELELLTEYIIQKMPKLRREIYLLNLKEGLSPAEIAARLDITPKKVRDHIYEARGEIREALAFAILLLYIWRV